MNVERTLKTSSFLSLSSFPEEDYLISCAPRPLSLTNTLSPLQRTLFSLSLSPLPLSLCAASVTGPTSPIGEGEEGNVFVSDRTPINRNNIRGQIEFGQVYIRTT